MPLGNRIALELTRDWQWMDSIIRRPDIHDRTSHDGCPEASKVSIQQLAEQPRNLFLKVLLDQVPAGFFMLRCVHPGVYEVHTNLLPECRGREAVEAGKLGRDFMFLHTDCWRLYSLCPDWLPESLLFAQTCDFRTDYVRQAYWTKNGDKRDVTCVSVSLPEWVRVACRNFTKLGRRFHDQLFSQIGEESHAEDLNHDGMVGLTLRMAVAGQPVKAEMIYNEWAARAGYAPLRYLGERDGVLAVDITSAVITVDKEANAQLVRKAT